MVIEILPSDLHFKHDAASLLMSPSIPLFLSIYSSLRRFRVTKEEFTYSKSEGEELLGSALLKHVVQVTVLKNKTDFLVRGLFLKSIVSSDYFRNNASLREGNAECECFYAFKYRYYLFSKVSSSLPFTVSGSYEVWSK